MIISTFSDTHLRSSRPVSRKDKDYYPLQLKKFEEAVGISQQADICLHGGDLFHVDDSPLSLLYDVAPIVDNVHHFYTNPGNHDVAFCTMETFRRSGLGVISRTTKLISPIPDFADTLIEVKGLVVRALPYQLRYDPAIYWFDKKEPGRTYVVVAHDLLTTHPVPYPHTEIKNLRTNADLVLCSHWHAQFLEKVNDTWFVNSGPLDGQKMHEKKIKPAVVLIDINAGKVTPRFEFLKTTGYEQFEAPEEVEAEIGLADGFVQQIKSDKVLDAMDLSQAILTLGRDNGYSDAVVQSVLRRIQQAQACAEV